MKIASIHFSFQIPISNRNERKGSFQDGGQYPKPHASCSSRRIDAFSLVEVLVVVTILAILGALIAQIIKATTDTTRISNRSVDAASQARMAYDRLGLDLVALIKRRDTDFLATNLPSVTYPDSLKFLSGVTSAGLTSSNNRGLSLVAYKIGMHNDNPRPCLLRAGKAVGWSQAGLAGYRSNGLPVLFTDAAFPLGVAPADYDILVPGIIRMVLGFQLYPDDSEVTLQGETSPLAQPARGQIVYAPPVKTLVSSDGATSVEVVDLERISSLVIGLVALDAESLKLLDKTQTESLASAFAVPSAGTPMALWNPLTENVGALPSSLPLRVRQSVRVFQRAYPVYSPGSHSL